MDALLKDRKVVAAALAGAAALGLALFHISVSRDGALSPAQQAAVTAAASLGSTRVTPRAAAAAGGALAAALVDDPMLRACASASQGGPARLASATRMYSTLLRAVAPSSQGCVVLQAGADAVAVWLPPGASRCGVGEVGRAVAAPPPPPPTFLPPTLRAPLPFPLTAPLTAPTRRTPPPAGLDLSPTTLLWRGGLSATLGFTGWERRGRSEAYSVAVNARRQRIMAGAAYWYLLVAGAAPGPAHDAHLAAVLKPALVVVRLDTTVFSGWEGRRGL